MKYDIYIEEKQKSGKFYFRAIEEYKKRLGRYCKITIHTVKKEKEWLKQIERENGMEKRIIVPGKSVMTSEKLSEMMGMWETSGKKGVEIYIPDVLAEERNKEGEDGKENCPKKEAEKIRNQYGKEELVLSDFSMSPVMTGMILCEQIYRGYRILHHHPYHK